jgi:hypothetical protein
MHCSPKKSFVEPGMHMQSFDDVFAVEIVVEKKPHSVQFVLPHPGSYFPTAHCVHDV